MEILPVRKEDYVEVRRQYVSYASHSQILFYKPSIKRDNIFVPCDFDISPLTPTKDAGTGKAKWAAYW